MRTKPSNKRMRPLFALAGLALSLNAALAAVRPFDELVPADAVFFMSLRNYPALAEKYRQTPFFRLLKEPEVNGLLQAARDAISKKLDEATGVSGVEIRDVPKMLSGELALASDNMQWGRGGNLLMLIDVSKNRDLAQSLIEKAIAFGEREGAEVTKEQFRGQQIYRLKAKPGAVSLESGSRDAPESHGLKEEPGQSQEVDPWEGRAINVSVALGGEILAICAGTDGSLLEKHLILRAGGDVPSLADSELYPQTKDFLDMEADILTYGDYTQALKGTAEPPAERLPFFTLSEPWKNELGFRDFKAAASGVLLTEEGTYSRAAYLAPAPRRGIVRALVPGRARPAPPSFVDADAVFYCGFYLDVPCLWSEVMAIMQRQSPQGYEQLRQRLQDPDAPMNLEADVINALGSNWYIYVPKEPITANPPRMLNFALTAELNDSVAIEKAFQNLIAAGGTQAMSTIDYMGKTIYSAPQAVPLTYIVPMLLFGGMMPATPPQGQPGDMVMFQPSFVFFEDKVVLAMSQAMAKACIRGDARAQSPLLDRLDVDRALQHLAKNPDGLMFFDLKIVGRWIWGLLDKVRRARPGASIPELPRYEMIQKYLSSGIGVYKWSEQGVTLETWSPHVPLPE